MEIEFGKYLCPEDIQGKTQAKIASNLVEVEKVFKGEKTKKYEMDLELQNGQKKKYSPNMTSLKALARAFGKTGEWNGHDLVLEVVSQIVSGEKKQVIYALPIVQEMVK